MAAESDQARSIAERVARRFAAESQSSFSGGKGNADLSTELAAMRASLGELNRRLGQIEAKVQAGGSGPGVSTDDQSSPLVPRTHSPWLGGVNASFTHPSQERFGVEEAAVTQLVDFFQGEKQCSLEPGGKPCDHCAMCSSRGF